MNIIKTWILQQILKRERENNTLNNLKVALKFLSNILRKFSFSTLTRHRAIEKWELHSKDCQ